MRRPKLDEVERGYFLNIRVHSHVYIRTDMYKAAFYSTRYPIVSRTQSRKNTLPLYPWRAFPLVRFLVHGAVCKLQERERKGRRTREEQRPKVTGRVRERNEGWQKGERARERERSRVYRKGEWRKTLSRYIRKGVTTFGPKIELLSISSSRRPSGRYTFVHPCPCRFCCMQTRDERKNERGGARWGKSKREEGLLELYHRKVPRRCI